MGDGRIMAAGAVTPETVAPRSRETTAVATAAADLLVLSDVHKRWEKRSILEELDLSVVCGSLVSIRGANGTGKTTLLRIAAGMIHADFGQVSLDGLDPERNRRAYLGRLGFLSAGDRSLYARLSARRHLDLAARLALLPSAGRVSAVERALGVFALDDVADRRVDRLSTGQRQRVRLAMTFVHDPPLILLDEPANSLDQEGLRVLAGYLEELRRRGGASVWCAPDGTKAPLVAETAWLLIGGRLRPA